jgi:hypothetical protein
MVAPISRSDQASESASSGVLAGVGTTGDSIGVDVTPLMAAADITPAATLFITGAASVAGKERAADFPAVPALRPEVSTGTGRQLEDTPHPAARVAPAREPSATSKRVDRQRAIRHVEAPALVVDKAVVAVAEDLTVAAVAEDLMVAAVAEDLMVAAADIIDQRFLNGPGSS